MPGSYLETSPASGWRRSRLDSGQGVQSHALPSSRQILSGQQSALNINTLLLCGGAGIRACTPGPWVRASTGSRWAMGRGKKDVQVVVEEGPQLRTPPHPQVVPLCSPHSASQCPERRPCLSGGGPAAPMGAQQCPNLDYPFCLGSSPGLFRGSPGRQWGWGWREAGCGFTCSSISLHLPLKAASPSASPPGTYDMWP